MEEQVDYETEYWEALLPNGLESLDTVTLLDYASALPSCDADNWCNVVTLDLSPLPQEGYIRLPKVLGVIPVSKSTWYEGMKDGRFPKPTKKFGPKVAAWDVCEIRALLAAGA